MLQVSVDGDENKKLDVRTTPHAWAPCHCFDASCSCSCGYMSECNSAVRACVPWRISVHGVAGVFTAYSTQRVPAQACFIVRRLLPAWKFSAPMLPVTHCDGEVAYGERTTCTSACRQRTHNRAHTFPVSCLRM